MGIIRVAVTNLAKYNAGQLIYKWLDLPATEEEIEATLKEIGVKDKDGNYGEYFITDYELRDDISQADNMEIGIGEYTSLETLNEIAEKLEELEAQGELEKVFAILEYQGGDLKEAVDSVDDYELYPDIHDEEELGYAMFQDIWAHSIPEEIRYHFDYEGYGEEIAREAAGAFTRYGWLEQL